MLRAMVTGRQLSSSLGGQGKDALCPPLLFVLHMKPMAQRLRDNIQIEGVKFGADTHKISLYLMT